MALARSESPVTGMASDARARPRRRSNPPARLDRAARGTSGSRRLQGSTPPGSRRRRAAARPARSASARVSSLVCSPRGNQIRSSYADRVERACRTGPCRVGPRARSEPAAMLDDPGVVAGRQARGAGALREREQLWRSGSRRCSGCTDSASRRARSRARTARRSRGGTPRAGRASRAGRRAGGTSRAQRSRPRASSRRAPRRPVGVDPEPERHADRGRDRPEQRHGAVDTAAHRDGEPLGIRRGA